MTLPKPTDCEQRSLSIVIEDWHSKTKLQQAICLCFLRGDDTPEKIANTLEIHIEDVGVVLHGVWGVLYARTTGKLWLRKNSSTSPRLRVSPTP